MTDPSDRSEPIPFDLSPEEMRKLGYDVIDRIVEHFETVREQRVTQKITRADARARFAELPPEHGADAASIVRETVEGVLANAMRLDHPRFFAYIPSPHNYVSVLAEALVAGFNPFGGTWQAASGPTSIELLTIEWLRRLVGLPESAGGIFVSGGSMANLLGLALARHARAGGVTKDSVVYTSDQTHSSIDRGLRTLGFADDQLVKVESDDAFRIRVDALEAAVAEDRAAGRRPLAVVANAGTTSTGSVDPIARLADLCDREGLWLHADGAYGLAAVLSDEGRRDLEGIERVDSCSFDPHKWWFQPIETACLLVRDGAGLRDAFRILPAYLEDTQGAEEEVNLCDYGVQLTRTSARALKLWMSIKTFGLADFRRAIDRGLELARHAEARIDASPRWEVVSPARLGIVAFRYLPDGTGREDPADLHAEIVKEVYREGFAMLSSTVLAGRPALRLCTINPRTTEDDIDRTLAHLETVAARILARPA